MTSKRTSLVQAGMGDDPAYKSVSPPIYLSSTYCFETITQNLNHRTNLMEAATW